MDSGECTVAQWQVAQWQMKVAHKAGIHPPPHPILIATAAHSLLLAFAIGHRPCPSSFAVTAACSPQPGAWSQWQAVLILRRGRARSSPSHPSPVIISYYHTLTTTKYYSHLLHLPICSNNLHTPVSPSSPAPSPDQPLSVVGWKQQSSQARPLFPVPSIPIAPPGSSLCGNLDLQASHSPTR